MKTHCTWLLALATSILFATGQALAQAPVQYAGTPYAGVQQAGLQQAGLQQAGYYGCDSCAGAGCNACATPMAGGFRLADLAHGGCDSGACGPSACGPAGCGPGGGLGGLLGGGSFGQAIMAKANSRYGGYGTMMHGQQNGPFGGGGCCTPIWHDFHIEAMHLRRDDAGRNIDFTSRGAGGPIVLSTDDLDMEDALGFRATYAYLLAPSTNLELTYFGQHDWDDAESVTGAGDLWSVFSEFGGIFPQQNQQGFQQTVDAAVFHGIDYSSEMHNLELNLRRRWISANCLLHGSYLCGVRYVSLDESFSHDTRVGTGGFLNYDIDTENDMTGFQIGGDLFVCVSPRFKIGIEVEGGVYGNDAEYAASVNTREVVAQNNVVDANPINEVDGNTDAALLGEAGLIALFKVTPRLTVRGGYTAMYMDGLALASDNFNSTSSPFSAAGRPVAINDSGEAFYHGANLGLTWMW